jgi:hypothetical protein
LDKLPQAISVVKSHFLKEPINMDFEQNILACAGVLTNNKTSLAIGFGSLL